MIKACGTHKKDIMFYVFYSIIAEWSHVVMPHSNIVSWIKERICFDTGIFIKS